MSVYKTCVGCLEELFPAKRFFSPDKRAIDGFCARCKRCRNQIAKRYYRNNTEKLLARNRTWRKANLEQERLRARHYQNKNLDKARERMRRWRKNNPERVLENGRLYRAKNREKLNARQRQRLSNPKHNLSSRISGNMWHSLKSGKDGRSWEALVGYTVSDLMTHLELRFKDGMSWENMGEWHVDHIRPISSFNYNSPDDSEFRLCWNLWNLQPLWAKDNLSKGSRLVIIND